MKRRWLSVLVLVAALLAAGIGYYRWPTAPSIHTEELPDVELADADPLVASVIGAARALLEARPTSPDAWGRYGMVLFAHDYQAEALRCFARAEQLDSGDARWPYYQGVILTAERPDSALGPLERAADLSARDPTPRLRLAETLLALDRMEEAAAQVRRSGRVDDPRAQLVLGLIALRRGEPKAAIPLLQRAGASPHAQRMAHSALAEAHEKLGNSAASQRLQADIARLPKDPPWPDALLAAVIDLQTGTRPRLNQVNAMLNAGRTTEALALARDILRDDPDSNLARLALGRVLMQARDFNAAVAAMTEATRRRPDSIDAHLMLGGALLGLDRTADAVASFRKVLELNPSHALAHYNLASCLRKLGDRPAAKASLGNAIRCRPDLQQAHIDLAELLLEDGDRAGAADRLEDALRLNPGDEHAKEVLRRAQGR